MKKLIVTTACLALLLAGLILLAPSTTAQDSVREDSDSNVPPPLRASSALGAAQNESGRTEATEQAFESLTAKVQAEGSVRVIVGLRTDFQAEGNLGGASSIANQHAKISVAQDALLNRMSDNNFNVESVKRFEFIPFVAMEVNAAALQHLRESSDVSSIEEDRLSPSTLAESVPLIGGTAAWGLGYTGSGQTVAILDSGVDKSHPFLAGKVVSEACYSSTYSASNIFSVCPGGVTSSTSTGSGVNCSTSISGCDHGTHVAGIAAGKGSSFSGVAKDANIIAVQVFSSDYNSTNCSKFGRPTPCALSYDSDQIKGLERVYALRATYNISSVNISIGGGRFYSNCDANLSSYKAAIDNLRSVGIPTIISSGNEKYKDSMGAPACISTAISVGATGDGSGGYTKDAVTDYSNSASFLTLLAPGSLIYSSVPGGNYAYFNGTSMAAPHVTGSWAILKQKSPSATVDQILTALRNTGLSVTDVNGITKPRIKVDAALNALGGAVAKAAMTSPTDGSTLPSSSVTFSWTAGSGVTDYWLFIGNTPGAYDIYNADQGLSLSRTVSNLPTDGRTIYVTLWSLINGAWQSNQYSYKTGACAKAAMTSPADGSTLPSSTATFSWTAGSCATDYWLFIGNTPGAYDIYNVDQGLNRSRTVSNLPTDGRTIYVTLWTLINGTWQYNQYSYKTGACAKAVMTSPTDGSTLTSSSVTFNWTAGSCATDYWLFIGNTPGAYDIYNADQGLNRSRTVSNLPADGRTIYVTLWTLINGTWQSNQYSYKTGACAKAAMTSPTDGSTLPSSTATFSWTAGSCATDYWLFIGNTPGAYDIYNVDQGLSLSRTVANLPTDGRTIYVTLWSLINGTWQYNQYSYKTGSGCAKAAMTSPADGSTLPSSTVTFSWSNPGSCALQYWLYVGNSPGAYDVYNADQGTSLSRTVSNLPADGRTLYVTLWTRSVGGWQTNQYIYKAAGTNCNAAQMISPTNGSTFSSSTVTFNWSSSSCAVQYWLYIGNSPGAYDIYNADMGTGLSRTVSNLPIDNRTLYVTLWSRIGGEWYYYAYTYKASNHVVMNLLEMMPRLNQQFSASASMPPLINRLDATPPWTQWMEMVNRKN
ncbi:MAG TPA: S8 family serine peptidase [Pyrinomonadaceae bacterium]